MELQTVPQIDNGQSFSVVWNNIEYSGRRYRPGDIIDVDRYVTIDRVNHIMVYHFHDFHSPVESFNLLDVVLLPSSHIIFGGNKTTRFGWVKKHLTIIETREIYKPISLTN